MESGNKSLGSIDTGEKRSLFDDGFVDRLRDGLSATENPHRICFDAKDLVARPDNGIGVIGVDDDDPIGGIRGIGVEIDLQFSRLGCVRNDGLAVSKGVRIGS